MSWNYRVINHGDWLGLHEVHYDEDGDVQSYTAEPVTFVSASAEDGGIVASLKKAISDAGRLPVLSAQHLPG